jgi:hypothetical protein
MSVKPSLSVWHRQPPSHPLAPTHRGNLRAHHPLPHSHASNYSGTATPTQALSLAQSLPKIDRQWLGFGLLIISAIGLMAVIFFDFIKPGLRK